jgi:feruloyl esterase
MDSTNPDLSAFRAHGGKLIMLEHMSDYAQSPYAGIGYFQSVGARMGAEATHEFMRLYTAPGADHVGAGAPANIDMLIVLVDWVERGKTPGQLTVVEQSLSPRSRRSVRCHSAHGPHGPATMKATRETHRATLA